jgi:polyhydroxyalkanoate synthase
MSTPGGSHHSPQCSRALGKRAGTDDYSEIGLAGGHVGVFVSGKSQEFWAKALSTG